VTLYEKRILVSFVIGSNLNIYIKIAFTSLWIKNFMVLVEW